MTANVEVEDVGAEVVIVEIEMVGIGDVMLGMGRKEVLRASLRRSSVGALGEGVVEIVRLRRVGLGGRVGDECLKMGLIGLIE
jgi:hypothetical protein